MWKYVRKNKLAAPYGKFKCDDKLSRLVPSSPEVRRTRSKSIMKSSLLLNNLGSHMDFSPVGKRKEVIERLAGCRRGWGRRGRG